jgi:enoyl-CoA hydratase
MGTLRIEARGTTALVTLDRPPANALEHDLCAELRDALERLRALGVAAVVLTGSGRFFSAGLDLYRVFDYPDEQAGAFASAFDDAVTGWFALEKPVVAAVNGHALAGGAVLAATADFRLMADAELKTGLTEVSVGVPFPVSALETVRFSCAGPLLSELLLKGRTFAPAGAVAARLADEIVPAGELVDRALGLAAELGGLRAEAVASSKWALRADHLARMRAARASGYDSTWERWRAPDLRAAMERFRAAAVGRPR